ncbi:MAG TPA: malto-oligosyltrehalose synthase, partial [Casimicrobiaceae bacterium]|nr:malto-oligosyltrehalose synthase [Casimicrobiaceae bacterium]
VLQHGPASAYALHFDIDWHPPDASLHGKVLVPVLGQPYGTALEQGELRLVFEAEAGTFAVRYYDHRLPIDPRTYPDVLAHLGDVPGPPEDVAALRALAEAWRALPARDDLHEARKAERRERAGALSAELARLVAKAPALRTAVDGAVDALNGTPGEPSSFDALDALLDAQAWRVAFWRVAGDEINYRRFFDINELAGLRIDRDDVFDATHDFLLGLAAQGKIGGLRIDHPDGLRDPLRYFERLQERHAALAGGGHGIYVVVEKICAPHEPLPTGWPVHGETGYVFANAVNAVLVDPTARHRMDRVWRAFVGDEAQGFERVALEGKRAIIAGPLSAALVTLTGQALVVARADRRTRDFTFSILRRALAETAACFPVYRTYVSMRGHGEQDRRYIEWAVSRAARTSGIADASVFDFVRALLLGEAAPGSSAEDRARRLDFALAFQQFTAPVAAKGVEDTAFYRHTRLIALNEVGGDPAVFGLTRRAFHRAMRERALRWPHALSATSTHDNKRSEDVRARIDVIAERPGAWRLAVRRWSQWNRSRKREVDGASAPSRSDEYLLYQTLVGTLPEGAQDDAALDGWRERIAAYAVKAAREAKRHTSWTTVNEAYEDALKGFVDGILAPRADNRFLDDLRREAADHAWFGWLNSLSMALLKFTAPGVPDVYQGNEAMDLSLVDPDNRRPVDFAARRATLERLLALGQAADGPLAARVRALLDGDRSDAKLWLTVRALAFRNAHRDLVALGDYVPLDTHGTHARHVLAFARRHGDETMIVVAGRLF